ncbi:MAG: aldehyde:ferredoxin oxidoreductase [Chloroflexota bacterium]|nr:MAG: aldehyde:ferredoxin oxidoreductase [Chloroflexota bacterium]
MLTRKVACVDLTNGTVKVEEVPLEWRRKFLGGRGITAYLLNKLVTADMDPMSPDNPLIVGVGLLSGVPGFGTGRFSIGGLSPESGNLGESSIGGHFGAEMRMAGFDFIVVTGRSNIPCYLWVTNDRIEIHDARHLWGKDTWETQVQIRKDHRDERVRSIVIGPAGENLVQFACVLSGPKDAAGKTGMGCLMGSKNLKAVAARGSKDLRIAHPAELEKHFKEQIDILVTRKWARALGRLGTPLLLAVAGEGGWLSAKKEQERAVDKGEPMYAEKFLPYSHGMSACFGCAVHCRHRHYVKDGKYAGTRGEGPDNGMMGLNDTLGNRDPEAALYINNLSNRLGLGSGLSAMLSLAYELYQRGIITDKETGGPLVPGDVDAAVKLMADIAHRKGLGDVLADGSKALKRLPPESADHIHAIKGLLTTDSSGRAVKSFAFAQAVSTLGGHAHRNRPGIDVLGLPAEALKKLYGGYVSPSFRAYEGKALMIWWHEMLNSVCDGMGFCRFLTVFNSPNAPQYAEFADMARLAAGLEFTVDELKEIAERIYTTERLFLIKRGAGDRKDDALPERWFKEELKGGVAVDDILDREKFEQFLDEYYQHHGWDNNGHPTPELMKKLDLVGIAPANL